jgi:hypothetical protein
VSVFEGVLNQNSVLIPFQATESFM